MAQLRNLTTGETLAEDVRYARTWWEKLVGFLPKAEISPHEGLWFERCRAIHTLGMRAKIDLIFLDSQGRVIRTHCNVKENRLGVFCLRASSVVELGAGALRGRDVLSGDRIVLAASPDS